MQPITEVAKTAGIDEKYLEQYGKYKAKVDYNILNEETHTQTASSSWSPPSTPPPQARARPPRPSAWPTACSKLGKNVVVALREPSLGPVFGVKGGAAGGGYAQVVPDGGHQPPLHRRLPRHRRGQQPAGRHAGQPHLSGQRPEHRPAPHHLAAAAWI